MSQVLGAFVLLDFTMLRPVLAWRAFLNLWTVYLFNSPIFLGHGKERITKTADTESVGTGRTTVLRKSVHVTGLARVCVSRCTVQSV
jgi:hypothetical protein